MHIRVLLAVGLAVGCGDNKESNVDASPGDGGADACTPSSVHATVTRGVLTMDASQRAVFLDMAPPLERSALFYSVRMAESSPRFGAVLCELVPADTTAMTPAGLACRHESMGTDSAPPVPVTIQWQVVTFDQGARVQRGIVDTSPQNPQSVTLTAVDPAKSFVVLGGALGGGSGWGNNDFTHARLVNGTTLEIRHETAGSFVSWQVIELAGASVQRGTTSLTAVDTTKTVTLTAVPANSIVLATHTNNNATGFPAATLMLQASLMNATTLSLRRLQGGTAMDVAYEIVTLPFTASQLTTDFAAGESMKAQPVANLGATTGIAFGTMQAVSGQSTGATAYADVVVQDLVGEAAMTFTVSAGSVALQRASATAAASVSWNVVDFAKDACD